jgi:hypothetical protein
MIRCDGLPGASGRRLGGRAWSRSSRSDGVDEHPDGCADQDSRRVVGFLGTPDRVGQRVVGRCGAGHRPAGVTNDVDEAVRTYHRRGREVAQIDRAEQPREFTEGERRDQSPWNQLHDRRSVSPTGCENKIRPVNCCGVELTGPEELRSPPLKSPRRQLSTRSGVHSPTYDRTRAGTDDPKGRRTLDSQSFGEQMAREDLGERRPAYVSRANVKKRKSIWLSGMTGHCSASSCGNRIPGGSDSRVTLVARLLAHGPRCLQPGVSFTPLSNRKLPGVTVSDRLRWRASAWAVSPQSRSDVSRMLCPIGTRVGTAAFSTLHTASSQRPCVFQQLRRMPAANGEE